MGPSSSSEERTAQGFAGVLTISTTSLHLRLTRLDVDRLLEPGSVAPLLVADPHRAVMQHRTGWCLRPRPGVDPRRVDRLSRP
jgi:hypothetical protein